MQNSFLPPKPLSTLTEVQHAPSSGKEVQVFFYTFSQLTSILRVTAPPFEIQDLGCFQAIFVTARKGSSGVFQGGKLAPDQTIALTASLQLTTVLVCTCTAG